MSIATVGEEMNSVIKWALIIKSKRTEWIYCTGNTRKECIEKYCSRYSTFEQARARIKAGNMRLAKVEIKEIS